MVRYGKRDDMIVYEDEPFNAETGTASLLERPVTATDAFYVRNHGAVPERDTATGGCASTAPSSGSCRCRWRPCSEAFRERHVTATLQCAGNRRAGLIAIRDIPGEAPWGPGATGTATWSGVALADVLELAGPRAEAAHVGFVGADMCPEAKPAQLFGGSIPLDKAQRPEVLLAWAMNGEPLPPVHGAPLRVVVPGYIGARSVKWLERIELRSEPWAGYFQRVVYRLLAEDEVPATDRGIALGLIALNSAILSPADGATVTAGPVKVQRLRVRRRRPVGAARRRLDRRRRELGAGRAARGPRPLGVAPVADHADTRARRARDPRPRLGLLGGHAARGRGGAVEPEGLREQRPTPDPRPRRRLAVAPPGQADLSGCAWHTCPETVKIRAMSEVETEAVAAIAAGYAIPEGSVDELLDAGGRPLSHAAR